MKNKFTFKTEKSTGRYRSFYSDYHIIKLQKKQVGTILENPFRITLSIYKNDILEDGNKNRVWRNINLKKEFSSLQDAKDWLNSNIDAIMSKWKLYQFED